MQCFTGVKPDNARNKQIHGKREELNLPKQAEK
jgi:hypothetical protein